MGTGHVAEHLAAHGIQFGLRFRLYGAEALVDGRTEVGHVMSLGTGADAAEIRIGGTGVQEHAVSCGVPEVVCHDAFRHLGDGPVLPEVVGITEDLAVLIAHIYGFPVLPGLAESLVVIVDHAGYPCATPLNVGAHTPLIRSGAAYEDVIVKYMIGTVLRPVQHGAGTLEHGILVFMSLVILGVQTGAFGIDGDVLAAGEYVALCADCPDAVSHGNKFKHSRVTPFRKCWLQPTAVVFILLFYRIPSPFTTKEPFDFRMQKYVFLLM